MSLANEAFSGVLWTAVERFGLQFIQFAVVIVLARLLTPTDFGLVGMLAIIFAVSSVLVNGGFSAALIREPQVTEEDKATAFWLNLATALLMYAVIWVAAPAVAAFFGRAELIGLTRFMALNLVFLALSLVQQAELSHGLAFRKLGIVTLSAAVITGVVAIFLAYRGAGVWALAVQYVLMSASTAFLLFAFNPWVPKHWVKRTSFARLFGFGWKLTASGLLDETYQNIYKVVIGKFFAAATLGFYTQAQSFRKMASQSIVDVVQNVTYPLLSRTKEDPVRLKRGYRRIIKASSYVIFPAMVGMALTAKPLVLTLVGDKWLGTVAFLQILCVSGAVFHLHSINLNILKVVGRSDLFLRLELIKKGNVTIALIVGLQFGIWGLLVGQVISSYVNLFINMYYTRALIGYGIPEQLADIGGVLWQSVPLTAAVIAVSVALGGQPPSVILVTAVLSGILVYLVTGIVSRSATMHEILSLAAARFPRLRTLAALAARD